MPFWIEWHGVSLASPHALESVPLVLLTWTLHVVLREVRSGRAGAVGAGVGDVVGVVVGVVVGAVVGAAVMGTVVANLPASLD